MRLSLPGQAALPVGVGDLFCGKHLDGDEAIQVRVARLVDDTHAAFAKLLRDLVVTKCLVDH